MVSKTKVNTGDKRLSEEADVLLIADGRTHVSITSVEQVSLFHNSSLVIMLHFFKCTNPVVIWKFIDDFIR